MGKTEEQAGPEGSLRGGGTPGSLLLERLPEFCSVLVSGPPGVGKFQFLIESLGRYLAEEEPVVFVCVDVGPTELQGHLRRLGVDPFAVLGRGLSVIDGFTTTVSEEGKPNQAGIRLVSSLSNLEGLGMAITEEAAAHDRPVKVIVYTISTLFLHNSAQSLSKFFQIVSARVKTEMGSILFACQEGVVERRQENLLRSLVDGVIDMRFNGSGVREAMLHHLRGYAITPEWVTLGQNSWKGDAPASSEPDGAEGPGREST
ncbi:MAG: RAD55 family ATPase [Thermoplasmata archaeon]|nr:RAD55 family ATPase [Thermoplasmata archaeon]